MAPVGRGCASQRRDCGVRFGWRAARGATFPLGKARQGNRGWRPLSRRPHRHCAGTLGLYRKTLDETSLGDQMRPLIAKRDAALPLFLALACEELRVFGVFERVSERIQSLPSSLPALVEDALGRMELDHGRPLVSAALAALVCSREGLSESELLVHLGRHLRQARDPLPRGLWAPLRCALTAFLAPDVSDASGAENVVAITHGELSRAVMRRYLPVERDRVTCHKALAESFRALADPSAAGAFKGTSARAFVELPHHLAEAHEWKALQSLLGVSALCHRRRRIPPLQRWWFFLVGLSIFGALSLL
eukprot:Opistho-2@19110